MRTRLLALFLFLAATAFAAAGPVRAGFDKAYPPFEYLDASGKPAGFTVELARAVAREMGFELELVGGEWDAIKADFAAGRLDMLTGLLYSEERDRLYDFSTPHSSLSYSLFVRRGASAGERLEDYRVLRLGCQEGDFIHERLLELGLRPILFANPGLALEALARRELDAVVAPKPVGYHEIKQRGILGLESVGSAFFPRRYCFAVRSDNYDLVSRLNEGLALVKLSGEYDRIFDARLGVFEPKTGGPAEILIWVALVAGPLGIIALGATLLSRRLKRVVEERTAELRALNEELELRVEDRTEALRERAKELAAAHGEALAANNRLEAAIADLVAMRSSLIRAERRAVVGRLAAGLAHELNSPLAALRSAAESLASLVEGRFSALMPFLRSADLARMAVFSELLLASRDAGSRLVSRAERRATEAALGAAGLGDREEAETLSELFADMGLSAESLPLPELAALPKEDRLRLVAAVSETAAFTRLASIVVAEVGRAAGVIGALENYDRSLPRPAAFPVDLASTLDKVVGFFGDRFGGGVQLAKDYAADLPPVLGEEERFLVVWMNLVENSLEAMAGEGRLSITTSRDGAEALVAFEDTGPGIPADKVPELFTPYGANRRAAAGEGLGLSAAAAIVEEEGGSIGFENSMSGGSRIVVRLPLSVPVPRP
ncbi:MAG: transporter substrate-binding domain-containing protein [Spirochaetaceae bacterium]|nr:transporter substrate-binding domain-containing protein [Spirochaetaceae bacterium]